MENTFSVYVDALHETWQMPDDLAMKLNEHLKEMDGGDAADVIQHTAWFDTLSAEDKAKIERHKK